MAKVYTDSQDELTINNVLKHGLRQPSLPKWNVLRLALARSLRINTHPDENFDRRQSSAGGGEYSLEQMTGEGKANEDDVTLLFRALLSEYHNQDLFSNDDDFVKFMQRHVRRGLKEFRSGWMESHDFHNFLLHELFGNLETVSSPNSNFKDNIVRALTEIGISAEITNTVDGPRLSRYFVRLRDVNDYSPLLRGLEKLSFVLGLGDQGIFASTTNEPKLAALDVPRPPSLWRPVPASALALWLADAPADWKLPIFLGQNVLGEPLAFDLAAAPHLLVGGTTGSGKSVCLHSIVLSLVRSTSSDELKIILIDPKRVEFSAYSKIPHLKEPILNNAVEVKGALQRLIDEMENRESAFADLGARDIDDPRVDKKKFPRIVVFVEELADLLMQSGSVEEPLIRLAQKARATGIHLVLATQRPDAKTFSGLLRSNIPSRIALTVQKAAESKIILDENGAEKLLGKGDMLVKLLGRQTSRGHGVLIGSEDIKTSISGLSKRKR